MTRSPDNRPHVLGRIGYGVGVGTVIACVLLGLGLNEAQNHTLGNILNPPSRPVDSLSFSTGTPTGTPTSTLPATERADSFLEQDLTVNSTLASEATPTLSPTRDLFSLDQPTSTPTPKPTETGEPTVTPAVSERNVAEQTMVNILPGNFAKIIHFGGEYQPHTAYETFEENLMGKTITDTRAAVLKRFAENSDPNNWVFNTMISETMNISQTQGVGFWAKEFVPDVNFTPSRDEVINRMVVMRADQTLGVLLKQVEAWTDFEAGNLKTTNPQKYYEQFTKNATQFFRDNGVRFLENDQAFEPVFIDAKSVEDYSKYDFEVALFVRGVDLKSVNPNIPNPVLNGGSIERYHVGNKNFGEPQVQVTRYEQTWKKDANGNWVPGDLIPIGDKALAGGDATLFYVSQWVPMGDNNFYLNTLLLTQNPLEIVVDGVKKLIHGLFPTGDFPGGKEGVFPPTRIPTRVFAPSATPTPTLTGTPEMTPPPTTPSRGDTPTPTRTPRPTETPRPTGTIQQPVPSSTPFPINTETIEPTVTNAPTAFPSPTPRPTYTPVSNATATQESAPTPQPTSTPWVVPTPTQSSGTEFQDYVRDLRDYFARILTNNI